jgi:putative hydrolase of the HAD superfamily
MANVRSRVVVFDGDDTLWTTEPLYDRARQEARLVVENEGLDGERWEALERALDVANIARFGLSAKRFPTSCREAYLAVCEEADRAMVPAVAEKIEETAARVFDERAPLVPAAVQVLTELRDRFRLVLLTQGDEAVQWRRVQASGLAPLFDEIVVVPVKSPEVLVAVLGRLEADAEQAWMVGNSIPSDMRPALAVGMRAVWIDAHVWEHERREEAEEHPRMVRARLLMEVPRIVS